jgi:hypothetical protein
LEEDGIIEIHMPGDANIVRLLARDDLPRRPIKFPVGILIHAHKSLEGRR